MPSPFPGMDPYLEGALWTTFHFALLPGDADAPLDLQQTFRAVYELLGYDLAIDYAQPPDVPFDPAIAPAAADLLRAAAIPPHE